MFVLLLMVFAAGLLSVLTCLIMAAGYGLVLIALAGMIRNVRQEISRSQLSRILMAIVIDHALTAVAAFFLMLMMAFLPATEQFLPLVAEPDSKDTALIISIGLILAVFCLLWTSVAVLLYQMRETLIRRGSLQHELEWEPWLTTLIVIGMVFQIPTFFIVFLFASPLMSQLQRVARLNRQANLIWTLALATTRGLPLGSEVLGLARGMWGRNRLRMELFSENLDAGQSIANSLERQPGLVPPSMVMQIRLGEETGTLGEVLNSCATEQVRRNSNEEDLVSSQNAFMVLLIPLTFLPLIAGFMGYYLVPKFKKIFEDFGVPLGQLTTTVFKLADERSGLPFLFGSAAFGLVSTLVAIWYRDTEKEWAFFNGWSPRTQAPPLLRSLAILVCEHRPLPSGLEALETSHPRPSIRKRITRVLSQVEQGADIWEALLKQRLINSTDLMLVKAAERVRNLPWALEQIAETIERRSWQRFRTGMEILFPVLTICLGGIVLLLIVAFFLPLLQTINQLSHFE